MEPKPLTKVRTRYRYIYNRITKQQSIAPYYKERQFEKSYYKADATITIIVHAFTTEEAMELVALHLAEHHYSQSGEY